MGAFKITGRTWVLEWGFLTLGVTFKKCGDRRVQDQKGDEGQHPGQRVWKGIIGVTQKGTVWATS